MLLVANVIFLIGSLLCAVSLNVRMLIGGRAVQGIGGGGLLTLVNISISDLFSMRFVSLCRMCGLSVNSAQNAEHLLWLDRYGLGCCRSVGTRIRWSFYSVCELAMVLLYQSYVNPRELLALPGSDLIQSHSTA